MGLTELLVYEINYINFCPSIFLVLQKEIWHFHTKVWYFLALSYSECFDVRPSFVFVFSLRLSHLQNMVLNTPTVSTGDEHFDPDVREKSHWVLSQGCTADDPSIRRLLLCVFRISPKTLDKQIVVYYSELTVVHCSSGTVASWIGDHCTMGKISIFWVFSQFFQGIKNDFFYLISRKLQI